MTRFLLIFWFIVYCVRYRALPWNFFQLNAEYFNEQKGIFSKLDIDRFIPKQWRLRQFCEDGCTIPVHYPVFIKPEWGQNSHGIKRADSRDDFFWIRSRLRPGKISYIVQEAASGALEYELFYIRSPSNAGEFELLSITEVINKSNEKFPINGVHDKFTSYLDRTDQFSGDERARLWGMLKAIGSFRLARVGVHSDSREELLAGNFKIIEINLFLPMPLSLLDKNLPWTRRMNLLRRGMAAAAMAVKEIPKDQGRKNIFFRKTVIHYRVKFNQCKP